MKTTQMTLGTVEVVHAGGGTVLRVWSGITNRWTIVRLTKSQAVKLANDLLEKRAPKKT